MAGLTTSLLAPETIFAQIPARTTAQTSGQTAVQTNGKQPPVAMILVRVNSEVKGREFTLGQIAEIRSKDAALTAQLAAVPIGAVALPGSDRLLAPGDIIVHLRAAGMSAMLESHRIELIAPTTMHVLRSAHLVSADEIAQAALTSAQEALKNATDTRIEPLMPVNNGNPLILPDGKIRLVPAPYRGEPDSGTISVTVGLLVDDRLFQSIEVPLRLHRQRTVVVATRQVEVGEILGVNDIALKKIELPVGFVQPVTDLNAALGRRMQRRVYTDAPISSIGLETLPDVTINAGVTIEFSFGNVHITATGQAKQAGRIGDIINVYAFETHKLLPAVIIDAHTVRIQQGN